MKMKTQPYKIYGMQQNSSKRKVDSNIGLPQKLKKSQINKITCHLKDLEKELTRPKLSKRKAIIKIREGVPIVAQWYRSQLVSMRMRVWSLASLSGLKIWRCHELWCRSQTQLGSGVAVPVV